MKKELSGKQVIVPMVSPFTSEGLIDTASVDRMCTMFAEAGVSVFALGTTGEGDSIAQSQREELVRLVVNFVEGRVPVYAGLAGNSLADSILDAKKYAEIGADYLVAKLPAYYPMNADQMFQYLEKLADSVKLPLFIYNIPATTHHSIPLEIAEKLSYHPNIYGLKDSERNKERLDESIRLWGERDDFDFLIGWAAMSAYGLQKGANGIVPSTGNISPEWYVQLVEAVNSGNYDLANDLQEKTDRVSALYQKDRTLSQSIPALKTLMKVKGICQGTVLPPMLNMTLQEEEIYLSGLKVELKNLNL